jgi:uncharacterized protein (DUF2062 family)
LISIQRLKTQLHQILHLDESPQRTALAFAVGVFIAFSPTHGLHTLMALFCTWAFRLNFLALMAGVFVNNPWTFVPILGATLWTGLIVLGMPPVEALTWSDVSFATVYRQVSPYIVPFLVGGLVLSVLGAAISYPISYWVISKYRVRKTHAPAGNRLPT